MENPGNQLPSETSQKQIFANKLGHLLRLQKQKWAVQPELTKAGQGLPASEPAPASAPARKEKSDSGGWVCAVLAVILFVLGVVVPATIFGSRTPIDEPALYLYFFVFQGLALFFGLLGLRHRLGSITAIMAFLLMVVYVCSLANMSWQRNQRERRLEYERRAAVSSIGARFIRNLLQGNTKATLDLLSSRFRARIGDKGGKERLPLDTWERYLEQKPDYQKLRMYAGKSLPGSAENMEDFNTFSYELRFTTPLKENEAEELVIHLDLVREDAKGELIVRESANGDWKVDDVFFSVILYAAGRK
jgi:hypothetical protein